MHRICIVYRQKVTRWSYWIRLASTLEHAMHQLPLKDLVLDMEIDMCDFALIMQA